MSARPYGPLAGRCHFINRPITSWHGQGLQGLRRHGSKPVTPTHTCHPQQALTTGPSAGHLLRRERKRGRFSAHLLLWAPQTCSLQSCTALINEAERRWRAPNNRGTTTAPQHSHAHIHCTGCVIYSYRTWILCYYTAFMKIQEYDFFCILV